MVFLQKFREVIIDDFSIVKETGVGEGPFGCFCYLIVIQVSWGFMKMRIMGLKF